MRWQFILVFVISFVFYSCENDLTNIGANIQPAGDAIITGINSFGVNSENFDVPFIYSKPDSLILGTFYDDTYGSLSADVLTQLQPPVGVDINNVVTYPATAKADSAKLMILYYSWFGDKYSPLEVNVYKMDQGKTFKESELYPSNIKVEDYCSKSVLLGSKVFSAADYAGGRANPYVIQIDLDTSLIFGQNKFSSELKASYTLGNEAVFHNKFNGLYITSKFGTASLLNVQSIYMRYYYHYTYVRKTVKGLSDSTVTVSHYQDYPANKEVRTVNRVEYIKKSVDFGTNINVVSSPANTYTRITLPLKAISDSLSKGVRGKKMLINRAIFRVDATDVKDTTLAVPLVSSILMLNEDSVDNYFKTRKLPTNYNSVLGSVTYEYDSNNELQYFYKFDMSKVLTHELAKNPTTPELKFRLIPVSISYDGSQNIKEIKQQNLMRAVKLCSGTHPTKPMKLQMVYSGF
jgi:hypothetical protein